MNRPSFRLAHLAAAAVLAASPAVSPAQNAGAERNPSPGKAAWIAMASLFAPIVLASATEVKGLTYVAAATTLLAPMAGYAYGGIPEKGLAPLGRRLLVIGATAGMVGVLCAGDGCPIMGDNGNAPVAGLIGLAGGATFIAMTFADIGSVSGAVRENNAKRVAISPAWVPANRAVGLAMKIGF